MGWGRRRDKSAAPRKRDHIDKPHAVSKAMDQAPELYLEYERQSAEPGPAPKFAFPPSLLRMVELRASIARATFTASGRSSPSLYPI
jgi:hypothetical protein